MKIRNKIIILILAILSLTVSFYLYSKNKITQVDKKTYNLTINEELKDINFCGKNYKAKQLFLNEIDIGQKIANIITKDLIPSNVISYGQKLKLCAVNMFGENEKYVDISYIKNNDIYVIKFFTKVNMLSFSVVNGEIFYDDMYGGIEIGPIGNAQ